VVGVGNGVTMSRAKRLDSSFVLGELLLDVVTGGDLEFIGGALVEVGAEERVGNLGDVAQEGAHLEGIDEGSVGRDSNGECEGSHFQN